MAITTLTSFVNALEALSVTGVTKTYSEGPPRSLNTAQLPAMWVQLPWADDRPLTFGTQGGWPTLRAEIVIAYEVVAQSVQTANFTGTVTQIDNLNTAIRAAGATDFCKSGVEWEVRQDIVLVGEYQYWAVIATVEGRG